VIGLGTEHLLGSSENMNAAFGLGVPAGLDCIDLVYNEHIGAHHASARAGSWASQRAPWPSMAACQDLWFAGEDGIHAANARGVPLAAGNHCHPKRPVCPCHRRRCRSCSVWHIRAERQGDAWISIGAPSCSTAMPSGFKPHKGGGSACLWPKRHVR